jgi:hypothetical protein
MAFPNLLGWSRTTTPEAALRPAPKFLLAGEADVFSNID